MRDSATLIADALRGIRPQRTPIFDLFLNDRIIAHFAEGPLDGSDDEATCTRAVARGLDATRGRHRPRPVGRTWTDAFGNVMVNERWTCWLQQAVAHDVPSWKQFILRDCTRLEETLALAPEPAEAGLLDQQAYNEQLGGTVCMHCTPSTALNAVLFGYHCGLEHFAYLWADCRDLVRHWLGLIQRDQLRYVAGHAHAAASPLAMIYSDLAFKGRMMFSRSMLGDIGFFDDVTALCAACHERGLKVIFHSDGYFMEILDDLVAAGIDGLNPIEKAAGMDIDEIRSCHPQLILVGGVDVTHLLREAAPAAIRRETRRIIESVGADGRLLIGSSTEVNNEVPLANYLAFHGEVMRG